MTATLRRSGSLGLALACLALGACRSEPDGGPPGNAGSPGERKEASSTRTPPPPYSPPTTEVSREGKRVAGRTAQALTTYEPGATAQAVARRVGPGDGDLASLARMLDPVVNPDARSSSTVVYPQLGGLTADAMSVMVVVRQRREAEGGATATETRTLDVRLRLVDGRWRFAELASVGGTAVERPLEISAAARAVVDNPRIELPDSARWDIYRGEVDEELLQTMVDAARRHAYAVAVFKSGHPYEVFGTDRPSAHTAGYAVDVYAVDGAPVVQQRESDTPAHRLASSLYAGGVSQIGSPWLLGTGSFSDAVHQDHIHLQKQQVPY